MYRVLSRSSETLVLAAYREPGGPGRLRPCPGRTSRLRNAIGHQRLCGVSDTRATTTSVPHVSDSIKALMLATLPSIIVRICSAIESSMPGISPPIVISVLSSPMARKDAKPSMVIGPSWVVRNVIDGIELPHDRHGSVDGRRSLDFHTPLFVAYDPRVNHQVGLEPPRHFPARYAAPGRIGSTDDGVCVPVQAGFVTCMRRALGASTCRHRQVIWRVLPIACSCSVALFR